MATRRRPTTTELFGRYRSGDIAARDQIVERFMPLARSLALRHRRRPEPLDDLRQVAYVGLLKAIDRFDPARGTAFTSYAVPTISGELKRHFRDFARSLAVPRAAVERAALLERAKGELATTLGRWPTIEELADALGCTADEVREARAAARAMRVFSLDATVPGDGADPPTFIEIVGEEDTGYERVEARDAIAARYHALPARERHLLLLRFSDDLTQAEIARRMGYSQMHVSRLLRQTLARLAA